jgi:hypothetical protein
VIVLLEAATDFRNAVSQREKKKKENKGTIFHSDPPLDLPGRG